MKNKAKEAFAAAIVQTLWLKGMITSKERDRIQQKTQEKLTRGNC